MTIKDFIDYNNISFSDLAEASDIPESTLRDILDGKSDLRRCTAQTVSKLAAALHAPVGGLLLFEPIVQNMPRPSLKHLHEYTDKDGFKVFRKKTIEILNDIGRYDFVNAVLDERIVEYEYSDGNYANALFLIGMTDYCLDQKPVFFRITRYDRYRGDMMSKTIYPFGECESQIAEKALLNSAIPELLKYNFIETPETIQIP